MTFTIASLVSLRLDLLNNNNNYKNDNKDENTNTNNKWNVIL